MRGISYFFCILFYIIIRGTGTNFKTRVLLTSKWIKKLHLLAIVREKTKDNSSQIYIKVLKIYPLIINIFKSHKSSIIINYLPYIKQILIFNVIIENSSNFIEIKWKCLIKVLLFIFENSEIIHWIRYHKLIKLNFRCCVENQNVVWNKGTKFSCT